jgi:hypothetical protein
MSGIVASHLAKALPLDIRYTPVLGLVRLGYVLVYVYSDQVEHGRFITCVEQVVASVKCAVVVSAYWTDPLAFTGQAGDASAV